MPEVFLFVTLSSPPNTALLCPSSSFFIHSSHTNMSARSSTPTSLYESPDGTEASQTGTTSTGRTALALSVADSEFNLNHNDLKLLSF